ncbi:MAG: tRNA (adenine(22)-N(1))-methyltransferase [Bacillota bacterium]
MEGQLSPRLAAVAQRVMAGYKMADIGTDHGYLPIFLVKEGIIPAAVASDISFGPYQSAYEQVQAHNLEHLIEVRHGDGLTVLEPHEVFTVVMAGMGGSTMIGILEAVPEVTRTIQRLVLQPMEDAPRLREWLVNHGWIIIDEDLVKETDRYYVILVAEPGLGQLLKPLEAEIGPHLLAVKHPHLMDFIARQEEQIKKIQTQLNLSSRPEVERKRRDLTNKLMELERVKEWLSGASE